MVAKMVNKDRDQIEEAKPFSAMLARILLVCGLVRDGFYPQRSWLASSELEDEPDGRTAQLWNVPSLQENKGLWYNLELATATSGI
jgi:hypothetical protein